MATINIQEGWNMIISIIDNLYRWNIVLSIWLAILTGMMIYILFKISRRKE